MEKTELFLYRKDDSILHPMGLNKQFPWLVAGFSTRQQGMSKHPYAYLNVGLHVGDVPKDVVENRRKVVLSQGFLEKQWVSADQVHGSNLYRVTPSDRGRGYDSLETAIPNTDALYTTETGLFLASFYADCVPIYFIDVEKRIVGIAHAGWKGTAAQIGLRLVEQWQSECQSNLEDVRVLIGPSIGPCCYEVDQVVINHFNKFSDINPSSIKKTGNNKYMLDLKQINYDFLVQAGVKAEHIEVSHWCTSCYPELFFSHRRDQGKTGRMVAFIGIKEERND